MTCRPRRASSATACSWTATTRPTASSSPPSRPPCATQARGRRSGTRSAASRVLAARGRPGADRGLPGLTWQFVLTGLLIGALVGMTGMGGGSLMTPILIIFFGFKPTLAVGTDLLHGAIFKSFGAVRHRRLGTVHAHLVLWMFLGSGPMSLLGVAGATWLKHHYGGAES